MGQYLRKGSQVYIEGRLQTRKWQDNNGQDRYTTEILADQMQMLGGRQSGGSADFQSPPAQSAAPMNKPQQEKFKAPEINHDDDFGDDIPF